MWIVVFHNKIKGFSVEKEREKKAFKEATSLDKDQSQRRKKKKDLTQSFS